MRGVVRLATFLSMLVLSVGCAQVKVQTLAEQSDEVGALEYELSMAQQGPVTSYENLSLHRQAEQLCPNGYSFLLRHAESKGLLANHHFECVQGQCGYQLTWRIRCGNVPREPFSLFGKT